MTECFQHGDSLYENERHLSIKRGKRYRTWFQCFAVWIPDSLRGEAAFRRFEETAEFLNHEIKEYPEKLQKCVSQEDFLLAERNGKCGAILTVEGGAALGGDLENVDVLAQRGVRFLTLTWNGRCEIGDGCGVEQASGLTAFGKAALQRMERRGIVPDVSHASDALFADAAALAEGPLVATHSNARRICSHLRNLTDEQFLEIRRRGGLVGLNFCPAFLRKDSENASAEDLLRHAEHFLSLGGEDVLCMGSDFDGTDMPRGIRGIESMETIAECFLRHGYSASLVQKIFYGNAHAFFFPL